MITPIGVSSPELAFTHRRHPGMVGGVVRDVALVGVFPGEPAQHVPRLAQALPDRHVDSRLPAVASSCSRMASFSSRVAISPAGATIVDRT